MYETIKQTADFIKEKTSLRPRVAIVLGSGLGNLSSKIDVEVSLEYKDIPNFPVSTVVGHEGRLIFGRLKGTEVLAMQGRFHYYEGYSMQQVVFPIRVMKFLGVEHLLLSNASGGMNPDFEIGDLMIITDHINLMGTNPLIGSNDERIGPRFPDMSEPYNKSLIDEVKTIARKNGIRYQTGTYAGISGPTFETPAEYKYIRTLGADAVGMSTVPENIAANHAGIKVFAISVITDLGIDGRIVEISHEDVIEAAKQSEPKLTLIFSELSGKL
ncbi:MAG: purine-nucleoside phosphorylase [Bacteroidales bacterium]|nr:purine-nucleoside phosphorylase [Bacteroidales bacterium]